MTRRIVTTLAVVLVLASGLWFNGASGDDVGSGDEAPAEMVLPTISPVELINAVYTPSKALGCRSLGSVFFRIDHFTFTAQDFGLPLGATITSARFTSFPRPARTPRVQVHLDGTVAVGAATGTTGSCADVKPFQMTGSLSNGDTFVLTLTIDLPKPKTLTGSIAVPCSDGKKGEAHLAPVQFGPSDVGAGVGVRFTSGTASETTGKFDYSSTRIRIYSAVLYGRSCSEGITYTVSGGLSDGNLYVMTVRHTGSK